MISMAAARRRTSAAWVAPGDAFVARRLREIVEPGELAGARVGIDGAVACVVATSRGVHRVDVAIGSGADLPDGVRDEPGLRDLALLVASCLLAHRPAVVDLPLDVDGTDFQIATWQALRRLPAGRTLSYGELSRRMGREGAARAVGQAVGANPVPVLVPCHRVLAQDGIGGFALGLDLKRRLLAAEGVTP